MTGRKILMELIEAHNKNAKWVEEHPGPIEGVAYLGEAVVEMARILVREARAQGIDAKYSSWTGWISFHN